MVAMRLTLSSDCFRTSIVSADKVAEIERQNAILEGQVKQKQRLETVFQKLHEDTLVLRKQISDGQVRLFFLSDGAGLGFQ